MGLLVDKRCEILDFSLMEESRNVLYSHIYISGDILEKMLIILGPRPTVQ